MPCLPTISLASSAYLHCEKQMSPKEEPAAEESALGLFRSFLGKTAEGILTGRILGDYLVYRTGLAGPAR